MTILITIVHVAACVILVLVVLLQAGKGADMGAVFGGASSTIFGSSGAGNFLTRLTTGAAIVFMATSLTLTYFGTRGGHSTIMPESAAPRAGVAQPAGGGDEAADVANSAPVAGGEAAAPAAEGDAAPSEPNAAAPAPEAAAPAPAAPAEPAAP